VGLTPWYLGLRVLRDSEQATMLGSAHLSSPGKGDLTASTGWLSPWQRGLVSLAGKKSPYVSRHWRVHHLQSGVNCVLC
jgi:hypothetical protein